MQIFTGRANNQRVCFPAKLIEYHLLGFMNELSPEAIRVGIQKLNLVIFNVDIGVFGRFPFNDQSIIAGKLQHSSEVAANIAVVILFGQRIGRYTANAAAPRQGHTRTTARPCHEDDLVFRVKGFDAGLDLVPEDFVGNAHTAQVLRNIIRRGNDLNAGIAQIEAQYFSCIAGQFFRDLHCLHWYPSFINGWVWPTYRWSRLNQP